MNSLSVQVFALTNVNHFTKETILLLLT